MSSSNHQNLDKSIQYFQFKMCTHMHFCQGLQCLLRQNQSSEKEIHYFFGNSDLSPLNI